MPFTVKQMLVIAVIAVAAVLGAKKFLSTWLPL